MGEEGQLALLIFVNDGGGLMTSEWVNYYCAAGFYLYVIDMSPVFMNAAFAVTPSTTFTVARPDPVMTADLPPAFQMNRTSYAGTETQLTERLDAIRFLDSSTWPGAAAVAGREQQSGRVVSFSTVNGLAQFDSPEFVQLFGNAMRWAAHESVPCYPDCDGDTMLTLADFGCFQTKFGLGDLYADCDGDSQLTHADFGCFQTKFGLGCP